MNIIDIFQKHLKNFVEEVKGELEKDSEKPQTTTVLDPESKKNEEAISSPQETIPTDEISVSEKAEESIVSKEQTVVPEEVLANEPENTSEEKSENAVENTMPAKKRGRPKKKKEEVATNPSPKKRGRPKKESAENKDLSPKAEILTPSDEKKEEPGKIEDAEINSVNAPTGESVPSEIAETPNAEQNVAEETMAVIKEEPKKKRGRPKKKKEVEEPDTSNEFKLKNPPKKRGRPKKQPVESTPAEAVIGVDYEEPVTKKKKSSSQAQKAEVKDISNYSSAAELRAVLVNSEKKKKGRPKGSKNKSRFTY